MMISVFFLVMAPARPGATGTMAGAAAVRHQPEQHEQHGTQHDGDDGLAHGALPMPANPMNAIDRQEATTRTSPMRRAMTGTSATSIRSRIEAMSDSASVSPSPAPMANTSDSVRV